MFSLSQNYQNRARNLSNLNQNSIQSSNLPRNYSSSRRIGGNFENLYGPGNRNNRENLIECTFCNKKMNEQQLTNHWNNECAMGRRPRANIDSSFGSLGRGDIDNSRREIVVQRHVYRNNSNSNSFQNSNIGNRRTSNNNFNNNIGRRNDYDDQLNDLLGIVSELQQLQGDDFTFGQGRYENNPNEHLIPESNLQQQFRIRQLKKKEKEKKKKEQEKYYSTIIMTAEHVKKAKKDGVECSICLSEFKKLEKQSILPCLHKFHQTCIDKWLEQRKNCPLCKRNFGDSEEKE